MAIYVLIHGGHHGSWCWDKVVPLLRKRGHLVEAPDLPGHGKDKTTIQEVTLQSCVDRVCTTIRGKNEPVILVGHSLAGPIISQAAEQIPGKIRTLVYLAAYLFRNGESPETGFERFLPFINVSQDQRYYTVKGEVAPDLFCNDCSADDIARVKALIGPETMAIIRTQVRLSDRRYGRVPRIYIECLRDQTILPRIQRAMYKATPCLRVISLNTGHSPFLSAPEQLTECLHSIADRVAPASSAY